MTKPSATVSRQYHSPTRERQASTTRSNITSAAERLLTSRRLRQDHHRGHRREAGVSTQTVYAVFGSKRGILAAILDEKLDNNDALFEIYQNSLQTTDVYEALRADGRPDPEGLRIQSPVYDCSEERECSIRNSLSSTRPAKRSTRNGPTSISGTF